MPQPDWVLRSAQIPVGVCSCACRGWGMPTPPPLGLDDQDPESGPPPKGCWGGPLYTPPRTAHTCTPRLAHFLPFIFHFLGSRKDRSLFRKGISNHEPVRLPSLCLQILQVAIFKCLFHAPAC